MTPFCHCCHRLQALASCHEKLKKAASGEESFKNHRLSCGAKQSDPRCGRPISNLCPCSGALRPRVPGTEGTLERAAGKYHPPQICTDKLRTSLNCTQDYPHSPR